MPLEKKQILLFSIFIEGILLALFVLWSYVRDFSIPLSPTPAALSLGLILTIPLLVVNYIFFGPLARKAPFQGCLEFKRHIVKPLADQLGPWSALVVSVLAGIGEESFFRGVLQNELGLIVASVAFAVLHFGPAIRQYYLVGALYLLFGFYFGAIYAYSHDLWVPIITHASYDFVALMYLKYGDRTHLSPSLKT